MASMIPGRRGSGESEPEEIQKTGMRSTVATGRGRLADKVGLDIDELDGGEEMDEVLEMALREQSKKEREPRWKRFFKKNKRWINSSMKRHKELVIEGHIVEHGGGTIYHPRPRLRGIVVHKAFETAMAFLIVSNSIIIGWQAELRNPEGVEKILNVVFEYMFTILFLAELVMRAIVFNWTFWFDRDNHLDIFLVAMSVLNSLILKFAGIEADFLRKASVLRILRLVRIAKNFRRQFKEMWQLIRGLVDSFETLFWTFVLLFCVLYFFAITATVLFARMKTFEGDEDAQALIDYYFDDVLVSMLTLWQIMTLDSWTSIVRPLMKEQLASAFFFVFFVTVADFLVMNLITSVIVTETFAHGRDDQAEQAALKAQAQEEALKEIKDIFDEMDEDGGGTLSEEELVGAWKNRKVRQKFKTMDIGKKDLIMLWTALDDGDGELTIEEFTSGMRKLKGEAKAKDILKLYREVRILESSIKEISILADYSKARMSDIRMKLRTTFRELEATRRTLSKVKETARLASKTQPLAKEKE